MNTTSSHIPVVTNIFLYSIIVINHFFSQKINFIRQLKKQTAICLFGLIRNNISVVKQVNAI